MQETKKITVGLTVKINNSDSLYHCIISSINLRQSKNEPNDTFKFRWDNFYETIDLDRGGKVLRGDQLVKVDGYQAVYKDKQVQVDEMKSMCFLLSSNQKSYCFLLRQLSDVDNVGRYDHPVTTTST